MQDAPPQSGLRVLRDARRAPFGAVRV